MAVDGIRSNQIQHYSESTFLGLDKPSLFTLLFTLTSFNALISIVYKSVFDSGIVYSILNTLNISAIVWLGLWLGLSYAWSIEEKTVSFHDKVVSIFVLFVCLMPMGPVMWPMISALALYTILTSKSAQSLQARAGWVFLAITVPMFWGKRVFSLFSDFFLSIDASLVASVLGTHRTSNIVPMPDGQGYLQIAAPCSSMANVSLAILCWTLFTTYRNTVWKPSNLWWSAGACLAVVAINVTRISAIGFFPEYYDVLHGEQGSTVVSWTIVFVVGYICHIGTRRSYENQV